jgi:hypothetical protein
MYTGTLAAASNKADWKFTISLVDPDTGDDVNLTGSTVKISVRDQNSRSTVLSGSTTDGKITLTDPTNGECQVWFTPTDMAVFQSAGSYDVGVTVLLSTGLTYQLIAGHLPVIDGVIE